MSSLGGSAAETILKNLPKELEIGVCRCRENGETGARETPDNQRIMSEMAAKGWTWVGIAKGFLRSESRSAMLLYLYCLSGNSKFQQ